MNELACLVLIATCTAAAPLDDGLKFSQLCDDYQSFVDWEFPEGALVQGRPTDPTRVTEVSLAAIERRQIRTAEFLAALEALDRDALSEADQLDFDLLKRELQRSVDGHRFESWSMPIAQRFGIQTDIPQMADHVPLNTEADYSNLLARLGHVPQALRDTREVLDYGLKRGRTVPRVAMAGVVDQCDAIVAARLGQIESKLRAMPRSIDPQRRAELLAQFESARTEIIVEVALLREMLAETYIPACRQSVACAALPDGSALYDFELERHTTTPLDAIAIHQLGLAEVARIRAEMMLVIRRTDWWNDWQGELNSASDDQIFASFVNYLRETPRFYCTTAEELLTGYREVCKRIDANLPALFGTLPRLPYGVREIPRFMAPSQTTAYYQSGSMKSGLAGWFCANTYALDQRPRYEFVPLALHEAVPGHHLQISLAQEMPQARVFRRDLSATGFVEGWALYAERLGIDMGLYENPYDDFGRLLYEMWRSCRLVVDTGIHRFDWSRQRAIDYMVTNTALSRLNIEREIDRYISWPGQACAYKIGELRIRALRAEAEAALGARFDIRAFHDAVLGAGAIPLDVLERRVRTWIAAQPRA